METENKEILQNEEIGKEMCEHGIDTIDVSAEESGEDFLKTYKVLKRRWLESYSKFEQRVERVKQSMIEQGYKYEGLSHKSVDSSSITMIFTKPVEGG